VLVVEDDAELRSVYRSALTIAGYSVIVAEDGYSALQQLDVQTPDAIVLDLNLPRLHGHDVYLEICSHTSMRDVPIIIVTGLDVAQIRWDFGSCAILYKPIAPDTLVAAVKGCAPPPSGFSLFS
jgi:two-component system response regulator MprA